ncbi:RNA 3'-terminal phosphate cyclase [Colletotrichum orchidophilum]|uniref:RNA 3'-terminal phosphate cyclase n=1 Tax=Colletotrichum orchidophilum TaxID=1209926 RepID=A0A1G4BP01_9PEZI|nr:RNA 3'-terminal phosphate cyclase [Colletotrichum orchidophilum]OHF03190.1 RNA 3'-terminal phosphate cyclase [Colletotrichum orchidophilum]
MSRKPKPIEIDGRTGEGGGQLVRVAIALAAVTSQPVRITNVRGNRPARGGGGAGGGNSKGGGLKAQHVTAIRWLAEATEADVDGLSVGSSTLTFTPRLPPSAALNNNNNNKSRKITIAADTGAASTLLILQAILPFLLYAAADPDVDAEPGNASSTSPIELEITGGTNVGWSLSYEYLDQVLLPRLESSFVGIHVARRLVKRGWSLGPQSRGAIALTIRPLKPGQTLRPAVPSDPPEESTQDGPPGIREVRHVDVSMIVPAHMHAALQDKLAQDITRAFPDADIDFKVVEDSGHDARVYTLLVARSASGTLRWGRDVLMSTPKKGKQGGKNEDVVSLVSRKVVGGLVKELSIRGSTMDEFLQDQLVIFQALADGTTSFPRAPAPISGANDVEVVNQGVAQLDLGEKMRKDRTDKPFGHGSLHSQTARWVASEILPSVEWYNKGTICKGVGISFS